MLKFDEGKMANETVLYLTHKMNGWILEKFNKLKETAGDRQVILLYNGKQNKKVPQPNFCFTNKDLWNLGYPAISQKLIPGQVHFPFFKYFKENKKSDFYWIIEYDVRFTGSWDYLFDYFEDSDADLISSLLRKYQDHPNWKWWELSHPTKKIKKKERIASFCPIYRISKKAAQFLDKAYLSGWKGHFEVSLPTLLQYDGFNLLDFGGSGEFTKGKKNKFYTNRSFFDHLYTMGTFRYRPVKNKVGLRKNKLYHPVKPQSRAGFIHNLRFLKHRIHQRFPK